MDGEPTIAATLTVAQAAAHVGVSTNTIYRAIEGGRLRAACLGEKKGVRTTQRWIDEWIESSVYAPKPQATPTIKTPARRRPRPARRPIGYLEA